MNYSQSSILCTSPRSPKWVRQGAGNSRPPASHPVPDYELYFISKGANFLGEAILFAVGEEEDETPHDWKIFFDSAINQNGNGAGVAPLSWSVGCFDISGVRTKVTIKISVCWAATFSVEGTYILKMEFIIC